MLGPACWNVRQRSMVAAVRTARALLVLLSLAGLASPVLAQEEVVPPQPPGKLITRDRPSDAGTGIELEWELSPDDRAGIEPPGVERYEIERATDGGEWIVIGQAGPQERVFMDERARPEEEYAYRVVAVSPSGARSFPAVLLAPVRPQVEWFDWNRLWVLINLLVLCTAVLLFIFLARRGYPLRVRRIAGLEAVDEAVGRATEMGRPCLYVPGIEDLDQIETVAGVTVLGHISQVVAEYDSDIAVPTARSLVMTAARETVSAGYVAAGRPDAFREDSVYYLTNEQFGYVAAVAGQMVRDRPAACFYFGQFYAESLILAETGNSVGAMQIAGTAQPSQLPFFVAACDYTLIGEEFFAASAYLSGQPDQLGSLKGQDLGKFFAAALIVVGCTLATLNEFAPGPGTVERALEYLRGAILG